MKSNKNQPPFTSGDELDLAAYVTLCSLKERHAPYIDTKYDLLRMTTTALCRDRDISFGTAFEAAAKALCEWESTKVPQSYFDVDSSTAFCLVVRHRVTGKKHFVSIKEIYSLIDRNEDLPRIPIGLSTNYP